jgi:hypothetical protein
MIEGIQFDIPSRELSEHLRERVTHHRQRSVFFATQAKQLEDGVPDAKEASGKVNYSNATSNPLEALKSSAITHEQKADLFCLMIKYLVKDETYRLTENDLLKLEFTSQRLGY